MKLFFLIALFDLYALQDLPTSYEYYTSDGITSGLSANQSFFLLNGKNITIYSGAMHYFRIPSPLWQDRLKKLRAAGLNTVETYIPWNLHEPRSNMFDFGDGGSDLQRLLDLDYFLTLAKLEDLFVIARPGPYICAEFEWGGFPSWLLRSPNITVRTTDRAYLGYVERYFNKLLPILAKQQFTQGGPIIAVQVENEYGFAPIREKEYLEKLVEMMESNGIGELLVSSDGASSRSEGSLPGVLFQTVNFGSDPAASFQILEEIQPGRPLMAMEFYPGWFDHWSESHHTVTNTSFAEVYESVISYPASVNLYMFHGGTNWGFLNGANVGPGDNSGFQPTTTSYDYDAPLSEAGDYTSKYHILRDLLLQYNPVRTQTPYPPELIERKAYNSVSVEKQLPLSDLIEQTFSLVLTTKTLSMEELPINDDSGQSYGYIIYRQTMLDIPADSVLTITGHIRDTIMVLINGQLVSAPLTSSADFDKFGYWRLANSNLTLTTTDLTDATLDLVIENWGRANFGNLYHQFKGLMSENQVFLNEKELTSWVIYPFEFKKSWSENLQEWRDADELVAGPGLYRAVLTIDDYAESYNDTFIDMSEWRKGIVIFNGFVLGRYAFIGPQQSLYLPGAFIEHGDNEILIFEHFQAASEVKFSKDPIFYTP